MLALSRDNEAHDIANREDSAPGQSRGKHGQSDTLHRAIVGCTLEMATQLTVVHRWAVDCRL